MFERDEEAWLAWRANGITATDVAEAASGTYGGAYAIVAGKLGLVERAEQTPQMARGHRWQPRIADAIHALTEMWVVGEETQLECVHDLRWRATLDGFLATVPEVVDGDDLVGVLEIKTSGRGSRPNRDRWYDQVQWQLMVSGLDYGVIAHVVVDDTDDSFVRMDTTEVHGDRVRQSLLVELAEEMWSHIVDGTLPEPDSAAALPVVKELTRTVDDTEPVVELVELADELARFVAIRDAVARVQAERDELEAVIRDRIGAATIGAGGGFEVRVSKPAKVLTSAAELALLEAHPEFGRTVLDRDRIKKERPDLYDAARTATGARRLTIKQTEGTNDE